jgi:nucleoside phosphorylase
VEDNTPYRTLLLDAVDRLDRPIVGVDFIPTIDGNIGPGLTKIRAERVPMEIRPADRPVRIEARLPGFPSQFVELSVGALDHRFRFAGAGEPTVLIVCALNIEMQAVLQTFDWCSLKVVAGPPGDPIQYWIGHYGKLADGETVRQVRLTSAGMGNNNAAIVATHALRSFEADLRHVLMVGIAGGCPNHRKVDEHVRLGDISVATQGLIQYDYIKKKSDGVEYRAFPQRPSRQLLDAANTLEILSIGPDGKRPWLHWIEQAAIRDAGFQRPPRDLLYHEDTVVSHPQDPRRREGVPRVHHGVIGSANILLKDPKLRDEVRDRFGARAIEMEGSGIMDAGWAMDKDIMVVRGVCDYCDKHKDDSWQRYAALAAAAYTRSLIEALPEKWFP